MNESILSPTQSGNLLPEISIAAELAYRDAEIDRLKAENAAMRTELQWERGRPLGKITPHWMRAAFDRMAAGEPEEDVMRDFGYERS
jgi:hypothetical protein